MKRSFQPGISRKRQHGQGLVGFIVAATFILIPATLATNYLARVGDANHKNLQAARYATWERTVWSESKGKYNFKSDSEFQYEVDQRVLANQLMAIDSSGKATKEASSPEVLKKFDPMLTIYEMNGTNQVFMLEKAEKSGGESDHRNEVVMTNRNTPGKAAETLLGVVGEALDLSKNGFYKSEVKLRLSPTRVLQDQLKTDSNTEGIINAQAVNAMLVGTWNAGGSASVEKTVRNIVPTDKLNIGPLEDMRKLAGTLKLKDLEGLDLGHVKPDIVPCHRLTGKNSGGLTCF